jgi:undecaprenyl-diphosphatase
MNSFIEFLKIVVFGVVEGFTEWLPISSTGHLILVENIVHLNVSEEFMNVFRVVIQLGAILAVLVLYFRRLNPFDPGKKPAQKRATWHLWFKIIIACLPAAVVGILLDEVLDKYLYNPYVVAAMLIIYGVIFIAFENRNQHAEFRIKKVSQISYQTAFYIGLFQLLALIPGTSRSGATILGDDARLFQNRGIGVHLLPWNSGHVRRQPLKDPSLRPGILRNGALLHGSCHGDRLRRFHVLDPVLTRICQKT